MTCGWATPPARRHEPLASSANTHQTAAKRPRTPIACTPGVVSAASLTRASLKMKATTDAGIDDHLVSDIFRRSFQCSSLTGTTESRDWRTSLKSLNLGSALTAAKVTGCVTGCTALISTVTAFPALSVGSG